MLQFAARFHPRGLKHESKYGHRNNSRRGGYHPCRRSDAKEGSDYGNGDTADNHNGACDLYDTNNVEAFDDRAVNHATLYNHATFDNDAFDYRTVNDRAVNTTFHYAAVNNRSGAISKGGPPILRDRRAARAITRRQRKRAPGMGTEAEGRQQTKSKRYGSFAFRPKDQLSWRRCPPS
ncbi:hypothetical protein ACIQUG_15195 [Ensifer sp. NPDC090286]|uniref:hypothetical protein n=1 Tax=Ensifer sp. NPDC090286 TaxID=3363991 RepID=UPI00383AACBD